MVRKKLLDRNTDRPPAHMAIPLEAQVRFAESRRKLLVARYKLGVRRGAAWFRAARGDHTVRKLED